MEQHREAKEPQREPGPPRDRPVPPAQAREPCAEHMQRRAAAAQQHDLPPTAQVARDAVEAVEHRFEEPEARAGERAEHERLAARHRSPQHEAHAETFAELLRQRRQQRRRDQSRPELFVAREDEVRVADLILDAVPVLRMLEGAAVDEQQHNTADAAQRFYVRRDQRRQRHGDRDGERELAP